VASAASEANPLVLLFPAALLRLHHTGNQLTGSRVDEGEAPFAVFDTVLSRARHGSNALIDATLANGQAGAIQLGTEGGNRRVVSGPDKDKTGLDIGHYLATGIPNEAR
jgi:hypothetical protein